MRSGIDIRIYAQRRRGDLAHRGGDGSKLKPFFLSDEFSVVDATVAPMLWRMRRYEVDLPPQAQAIAQYAASIFARPAFRRSLSDVEIEMGTAG